VQLSEQTAVIGQSVYTTPFVILLVAARLQGFDRSLERAAADLGANALNRLRLVVLPLILPAIIAGALFAFTLSIDEFIITYFLIGTHITLPIFIYTQVKFGITPEVNAIASMLLAASLLLLAIAFALPQAVRAGRRAVRAGRRARPVAGGQT
jgi:ABC-type spermidine/putrescine transport system permease subunit II